MNDKSKGKPVDPQAKVSFTAALSQMLGDDVPSSDEVAELQQQIRAAETRKLYADANRDMQAMAISMPFK